jgi:alpha-galactosidase
MDIRNFIFTLKYVDGKKRKELSFPLSSPAAGEGLKSEVRIEKTGGGLRLTVRIIPDRPLILSYAGISGKAGIGESLWVNGYQSWSETRDYRPRDHMTMFRVPFLPWIIHYKLSRYGDYEFTKNPILRGRFHSFTLTASRKGEQIDFFGSLDESEGFTIFFWNAPAARLSVCRELKGLSVSFPLTVLDIFIASGKENEVMDSYTRLLSLPSARVKPACGYTSWYNRYEKITQESIEHDLAGFSEQGIPLDFFQIDDGWQRAVGDWLIPNGKFPDGMRHLADSIRTAGYRPGLWLAPFIIEESSLIRTEHPDWILRDAKGRPVIAGNNPFNWSGYSYSLDIYHPEVREYLSKVFDTAVHAWGFELLKLDFLYAACIIPRPDKTRGRVMSDAMRLIKEISRGAILLGCGLPLASGFGMVDYCRIGSDVALSWEDPRLKALGYRERVSTINSITSTIGRQSFSGRFFLSDPDVFILRKTNNRLSVRQRETLFYANHIFGGLVFTSDDISAYDEETLAFYRASFPFRKKRILSLSRERGLVCVSFAAGDIRFLAFLNLSGRSVQAKLPEGIFFRRESGFENGGCSLSLLPYETRCYLSVGEEEFALAGSSSHVFPASEILQFAVSGKGITINLDARTINPGLLFIRIPPNMAGFPVNGIPRPAEDKCGLNLLVIDEKELPRK